jgi:predicted DNA-binding protein (MmcQ/YjbR family)
MDFEELKRYLLGKKGVTAERPFGPDVCVYKVSAKMFALVPVEAI